MCGGRVKPKFCELGITVPFYVYPVSFYTLYLIQYKLLLSYFVSGIRVYMSINSLQRRIMDISIVRFWWLNPNSNYFGEHVGVFLMWNTNAYQTFAESKFRDLNFCLKLILSIDLN